MIMAAISAVFTIGYVANLLGEDEDWLFDLSIGMEPEDGSLWVYGVGEDGVPAFTRDGIDNLRDIIADKKSRRKRTLSQAAEIALGYPAAFTACFRLPSGKFEKPNTRSRNAKIQAVPKGWPGCPQLVPAGRSDAGRRCGRRSKSNYRIESNRIFVTDRRNNGFRGVARFDRKHIPPESRAR